MDLPEWVSAYWSLWYFGFDAVLVLLALCLPLAFLTVLFEPG